MSCLVRSSWSKTFLALGGMLACLAAPALAGPETVDAARLAQARADARAVEQELVATLDRVRRASVSVLSKERVPDGGSMRVPLMFLRGVGSGVLVEYQGRTWLVTNRHVVLNAQHLEAVADDGNRYPLRVRTMDRDADLALCEFRRAPEAVHPVRLPGSDDPRRKEGTWVVATGNPFFLAIDGIDAASLGVISGLRPPDPEGYVDVPILQHDAEINPGSSGGPLWNLRGELVGINGTIATRSTSQGSGPVYTGASFSIPVREVRRLLHRTLGPDRAEPPAPPAEPAADRGPRPPVVVTHPALERSEPKPGLRFETVHTSAGRPAGARVVGVPKGGELELRVGDLVTRVTTGDRTQVVRTADELEQILGRQEAGATVAFRLLRDGRFFDWTGRLPER